MDTVSRNLENARSDYRRIKDFENQIRVDTYERLQSQMGSMFSKITKASDVINMRGNISPSNIVSTANEIVRNMNLQHANGYKYDAKTGRMIKP